MPYRALSVLLLDDNTHMRSLMRAILKGLGVQRVFDANDAAEAFEILRTNQIDIAFIDYRLGDLDGVEFAKLVRTAPDSPDPYLAMIMVTAYSERSRVYEAVNSGVDEFLAKPIRAADVAMRIDAVVRRRRAFVRTASYFGPDRRRREDPNYRGKRRRAADKTEAAPADAKPD
jgi:two-component system, chemotaxis family, chemotaxis protein CheY